MSSVKQTRSAFPTNLKLMATNLPKVLPSGIATLFIDNQSQTVAEVQADLQAASTLYDSADTAAELSKEAVAKRDAATPAARTLFLQVAAFARIALGATSSSLAEIGVTTQPKRSKPSAKTTAGAVDKAAATKAAGGSKAVKKAAASAAAGSSTSSPSAVGSAATPSASSTPEVSGK